MTDRRYFVIESVDGRTVPLHAPQSTMKFFDHESADLMLAFIRRLGHTLAEFAVCEKTGKSTRIIRYESRTGTR